MAMQQLLVRLPEELAMWLRRRIPPRHRSAFVQQLLEQALPADDDEEGDPLYRAALEVERDECLAAEMREWDVTAADGLTPESDATRRG